MSAEGEVVGPIRCERPGHGGFVVGRLDGRAVFVRHALPGELVRVRLTDTSQRSYWRGDAVEVLEANPDRVTPPCPIAQECGGCDLQHVSDAGQLAWKTSVLREQLHRITGLDWAGEVEPVPGATADRLVGWRTRMRYSVGEAGLGLRAPRSHRVVGLPDRGCLIADPRGGSPDQLRRWAHGAETLVVAAAASGTTALADGAAVHGPTVVTERVGERRFEVAADGFWQVHPAAASLLTQVVLEGLAPRPGEVALDLYCGVGLFAGALVEAGCRVVGVEIEGPAVRHARHNVPEADFIAAPAERSLRHLPRRADLVVLDPARAGAGRQVVRHVAGLGARAAVHIGCDPASFARDLRDHLAEGWTLRSVRAFDLFPMTQHLESVAILTR